jgi:glycosyltransferase involved in cell wall biosynthesis
MSENNWNNDMPIKLIYVGQVTPVRRIDFLLDIINEARKKARSSLKLIILGKIFRKSYKQKIEKKIERLGLKGSVEIRDEVPLDEVPNHILSSDIGLSVLPPIKAYRLSSPTKVVEYLSLGIPVIGNREIEDQRFVIESSRGGLSPSYDKDEIAEAIVELASSKDELSRIGKMGREWVNTNRNYVLMAKDLKMTYAEILRRRE